MQAVENGRALRRWNVCVSHVSGYRMHFTCVLDFTVLNTEIAIYATLFLFYWVSLSQLVLESLNWCQSLSTGVSDSQLVSESLD